MKLYSIRDWEKHFEMAQSRKVKGQLAWVAMPTKHDGLGYSKIMLRPDGPAIFGAWVVIVQVAAKCRERGVLADESGPFSAGDIALRTKFPEAVIDTALKVLSSNQIGWIVGVEWEHAGSTLPPQDTTEQYTTGQDTTLGAADAADLATDGENLLRAPPALADEPPPPPGPADQDDPPAQEPRAEDLPLPPALATDAFVTVWLEWIAYRRSRRLTCRLATMRAQLDSLAPLGPLLAIECLRLSIRNGWQGIFPEKVKPNGSNRIGAGQRHDPTNKAPVKQLW